MKRYHGLAAIAAFSLIACKSESTEAASGETAAATGTATASAAPAQATASPVAMTGATPGAKPTRDFMVGKWGEEGDCALAIEFKADGTMVGPFERWNLADGMLKMVGNPQKIALIIVDDKTMESQIGNDPKHKLTRC
ncbi:hypothetical protein [Novosphingobium album (ex Liu et al. 2023)]|uniref:Lipoprotein n=1 Tax=Novosphingobium album (ex Liu et al. 2023) TaxID=3031130 RepID=A0ABT5WLU5_9SPHN|nr:hypothetical protein [Novosphingobium album (ex Liu et al. 2023)]MDE8651021.1 hypothetical protein [Novosphingobium album (ex Liu et al. 2023)]